MMTVRGEEDGEHKDEDDHILRRRRRRRGTVVLPSTVVDVDAVDDLMTMAVPGQYGRCKNFASISVQTFLL